jgi:hypothetical protein
MASKTVAQAGVLESLKQRLSMLTPESPRRWGTMTAHEMLCHLVDTSEMALGTRPRTRPAPLRRRRVVKWLGLYAPIPWPRGLPTDPYYNPRLKGTRPSQFAEDLQRAIGGLERIAAAGPSGVDPAHVVFGLMSLQDWHRWTFKHTDHHLRQFGL